MHSIILVKFKEKTLYNIKKSSRIQYLNIIDNMKGPLIQQLFRKNNLIITKHHRVF